MYSLYEVGRIAILIFIFHLPNTLIMTKNIRKPRQNDNITQNSQGPQKQGKSENCLSQEEWKVNKCSIVFMGEKNGIV